MQEISYAQLDGDKLAQLVNEGQSFNLVGCRGSFSEAVSRVETAIEAHGLSCRVRTSGRVATVAAGLINPVYAVAASIGILSHRLLTIDPDYEIVKHVVDRRLEVVRQDD